MDPGFFQEIVSSHARRPRNFGKLEGSTHRATRDNPACRDQITVELIVEKEQIREARFQGAGCALSMAGASLVTAAVKGKALQEAQELGHRLREAMAGNLTDTDALETLGDLAALSGAQRNPARIRCALLGLETVEAALA